MRVAVLGAGVIGLSIAWRLSRDGHTVDLFDDHPGQGASYAAAGMLAPGSEAWYGETGLLRLGLDSLRRWPRFAADLSQDSPTDPWLTTTGTLMVGATAGDAAELDRVAGLLAQHGVRAEVLDRSHTQALEPGLSAHVQRVVSVRDDASVHNRRLITALRQACEARGVIWHAERADVVAGGSVRGRDSDVHHRVDRVVVAIGADAGGVRPVKGQILRVRGPRRLIKRTVRAVVAGTPVYAVPRQDGEIVLGATTEEQGFDTRVTVEGAHGLLRHALAVLPGLRDYEIVEQVARSRPGTADNLPLIGHDGEIVLATGHYRSGVLLAPLTAAAVTALVTGAAPPAGVDVCDPARRQGASLCT